MADSAAGYQLTHFNLNPELSAPPESTGELGVAFRGVRIGVYNPVHVGAPVVIAAPAPDASFAVGENVAIDASADDFGGIITRVEFLVDGVPVGSDTVFPYGVTWKTTTDGMHTVTARVVGEDGSTATSSPVTVRVLSPARITGISVFIL